MGRDRAERLRVLGQRTALRHQPPGAGGSGRTRSNVFSIPACSSFGDRLGPLLWQFAPTKKFDPADFGKFLELLPAKAGNTALRHVVEVRHPSFCAPDFVALARSFHIPIVFTDHARYPSLADATGDFIYARLQKGQDTIPTAYPPKELDAWAKRLRLWAEGKSPEDLPHIDAASAPKTAAPRDVFAYVIHEGKIRAPAAAMALIERLK